MSNVIPATILERKRYEKLFNKNEDPCSDCIDRPYCSDTCHHARMWWATAAKMLREGKL